MPIKVNADQNRRPKRRHDPLSDRDVLVAPGRGHRPQRAANVVAYPAGLPEFLADCPFCPGNEDKTTEELIRVVNPASAEGWQVRGFPNAFPILLIEEPGKNGGSDVHSEFFRPHIVDEVGAHEIIVESPQHNGCLSKMLDGEIAYVFNAIAQRYWSLKRDSRFGFFYAFKNYGPGTSLDHPHWQLEARQFAPQTVYNKYKRMSEYKVSHRGECFLCRLWKEEVADGRLVAESKHFVAFVPFGTSEPFETIISPKAHAPNFAIYLENSEIALEFASIVRDIMRRVKKALQQEALGEDWLLASDPPHLYFLYSAPYYDDGTYYDDDEVLHYVGDGPYHWHLLFLPRTVQKVGHERGTNEDVITIYPEDAAEILRSM